jgi:hypothetical protein
MTQEWKQLRPQGKGEELPLSKANARCLLLRALECGTVEVTGHFKKRGIERHFTTVDAETSCVAEQSAASQYSILITKTIVSTLEASTKARH